MCLIAPIFVLSIFIILFLSNLKTDSECIAEKTLGGKVVISLLDMSKYFKLTRPSKDALEIFLRF
jgi:competence protein ComGC